MRQREQLPLLMQKVRLAEFPDGSQCRIIDYYEGYGRLYMSLAQSRASSSQLWGEATPLGRTV